MEEVGCEYGTLGVKELITIIILFFGRFFERQGLEQYPQLLEEQACILLPVRKLCSLTVERGQLWNCSPPVLVLLLEHHQAVERLLIILLLGQIVLPSQHPASMKISMAVRV